MLARTSPRQALTVMLAGSLAPRPDRLAAGLGPEAEEVLGCAVRDALAALVEVDGATLSVVGAPGWEALSAVLPAGIDVLTPDAAIDPRTGAAPPLAWALRTHLDRAFERVVAVAPDAVPIRPRTASTALSALGSADLVVGPTPAGGIYLFGVRDDRGVDLAAGFEGDVPTDAVALLAAARDAGLVARSVERSPRLSELADLAAVRTAVDRAPELAPSVGAWLQARGCP